MPPIDGPALGELTTLLCSAFNLPQLERLVRFTIPDPQLWDNVPMGGAKLDIVFALLNELEHRGTTVVLLRGVIKALPDRADVKDTIIRLCPAVLADPADARAQVAAVVTGARAVERRLADPAVRKMVAGFQKVLVGTADQVDQLKAYKGLHDVLHKVQFRYYYQVDDAARRFKTDPEASDTLANYIANLSDLAEQARPIAAGLPDVPAARGLETAWIEEFQATLAKLAEGRERLDTQGVLRGVRRLKSLISVHPARLNQMLCLTAKNIPILGLRDAFTAFAGAAPDAAPAALAAREGLIGLQPRLQSRVKEHTLWQDLEKDLWLLEEYLQDRTAGARNEGVKDLWDGIKFQVSDLAEIDPAAEWAVGISPLAAALDASLASPPPGPDAPDPALYKFREYRRVVLNRFYRVDQDLNKLCTDIIALGQPLRDLSKEAPDAV